MTIQDPNFSSDNIVEELTAINDTIIEFLQSNTGGPT